MADELAVLQEYFDGVPSVRTIQERINSRYDALFYVRKDGTRRPFVCTFCDEFLLNQRSVNWIPVSKVKQNRCLFDWDDHVAHSNRRVALDDAYKFDDDENLLEDDGAWLVGLALSPRGILGKASNHHSSKLSFTSCQQCKTAINAKYTPMYAIVNQNAVGNAPACLTELTEVELALITPVKGYGYCFSYVGGKQKKLKGTMTFMRVEERRVCRAAMHLEAIGLTDNLVVLVTGRMTGAQQKHAIRKAEIRTKKILEAVEWLCKNHRRWQNTDLNEYRAELEGCTPTVINKSKEVESENANLESEELFACFYPDGATTSNSGGFDDPDAFKEYVSKMREANFNVELKLDLQREFVNSKDGDPLISTCLLHFPYGVGGLDEWRKKMDGSRTNKPALQPYLNHLSRLSQTIFQAPMFQLIMYSTMSKERLLRRSCLQLKGTHSAETLANGLNSKDLKRAIRGRVTGNRNAGTNASRTLLNAVDATSRALPHTNECAKGARSDAEALQHHFGIGAIFLTATFDDENSLIMQVLSDTSIDDNSDITLLTDEELAFRAKRRKALRMEFPGLSALNFEMLLEILIEEVVGWDMRLNGPTKKPGYFGVPEAFSMAIEEQARHTPHAHMTIYLPEYRQLQQHLYFGSGRTKKLAEKMLTTFHDHVVTTSLYTAGTLRERQVAFDHDCTIVDLREREAPDVVSDQALRHLRHRLGYEKEGGLFAYCPHCDKEWTYEELLRDFMRTDPLMTRNHAVEVIGSEDPATSNEPLLSKPRMLANIVQFQMNRGVDVALTPTTCINASYQHHASCHVKGCFKCQKNATAKKAHTCGPLCECRFRLPDRSRRNTAVKYISDGVPWYNWKGVSHEQPLVTFLPKRAKYDNFQNVSCRAVSESKFSCNSNAQLITDGPVGQYAFKYQQKQTQEDDTAEYAHVQASMKSMDGRTHEEDRREAIRIICRAAFAHNKTNVIGAPFAAYLVRNESRFYFSHVFKYCPLNDLLRVLKQQSVSGIVKYDSNGNVYFENMALHYLCRHSDLENVSVKTFYEEYDVVNTKGKKRLRNEDPILAFQADTGYFKHPSANSEGRSTQGVRARPEPILIKVTQWAFPDTGRFGGNLLTCTADDISPDMETYAHMVLLLLTSFRNANDFQPETPSRTPYTHRLREIHSEDDRLRAANFPPLYFSDTNNVFLQNLQDSAYNNLRHKPKNDDLQSVTEPLRTAEMEGQDGAEAEGSEDEEDDEGYEILVESLGEPDLTDEDPAALPMHLINLNFETLRQRGRNGCGTEISLPVPVTLETSATLDFVEYSATAGNVNSAMPHIHGTLERIEHHLTDIVALLLRRTTSTMSREGLFADCTSPVPSANGSAHSIVEWATLAKLDRRQKRAFECITAAFVLTFYTTRGDDTLDATMARGDNSKFRRSKKHLMLLKGDKKNPQLLMLLHGPGGSGKSTVINLVTSYAREFCEELGHPFTRRTIVVTAMSGVAATLLHGETTHSALGLNRDKLDEDMIDAWCDARLLIIDESSFAAPKDFVKANKHCSILMRQPFKLYGGQNVVFAGDYSQLEPPGQIPVYAGTDCPEFQGSLNSFIELNGMHRFKDDMAWGARLRRFREGEPTDEDVEIINDECLLEEDEHDAPPGVQVATYFNKDRDAINAAVFEEYCAKNLRDDNEVFDGAIIVLMDHLEMHNSKKAFVSVRSNTVKRHFWETCGEDDCDMGKKGRGRVDPMLKLYANCPLMLTLNVDVPCGQANGSRVRLRKVAVKPGETPIILKLHCGTHIRAFHAGQLKSITVRHEARDVTPAEFTVESKGFTFTCRMETEYETRLMRMKGVQFPVISNSATTGHKLQGCTLEMLLAADWNYTANWPYVVLSRVKTMAGLYIAKPLTTNLVKFEMPQAMKDMLKTFAKNIALPRLADEDYDCIAADGAR